MLSCLSCRVPTCTQTLTCVFCFGLLRTRRLDFKMDFLFMSLPCRRAFFLPCTMKHSDIDVFHCCTSYIIQVSDNTEYQIYIYIYMPVPGIMYVPCIFAIGTTSTIIYSHVSKIWTCVSAAGIHGCSMKYIVYRPTRTTSNYIR